MKRSELRDLKLYPIRCVRINKYRSDFCKTCKYQQPIDENYIGIRYRVPMIKRNICQAYKRLKND